MTETERAERCGCHPGMTGPCGVCRRFGRTAVSPPVAPCPFYGKRVDRPGQVREWHECTHPEQPLGPLVCRCRGCNPTCPGYPKTTAPPAESAGGA